MMGSSEDGQHRRAAEVAVFSQRGPGLAAETPHIRVLPFDVEARFQVFQVLEDSGTAGVKDDEVWLFDFLLLQVHLEGGRDEDPAMSAG
ncbi:hypothetical protein [Streptomyces sp. MS2.AVA.5]|uniref:Uncharacterized protein n=1 Tax=Streptomyces achmelvichensis TaxID=3134111 RepID=A0ACC6Q8V1_9ACTN